MPDDKEQPSDSQPSASEETDGTMEDIFREFAEAGNDPARQETLGMMALMKAAEWAEKREPTEENRLRDQASHCEATGDWVGVEEAHRALITLSTGNAMKEWRAYNELRSLLQNLRRESEAREAAHRATEAAYQSDLSPLIWNALRAEANCAFRAGDTVEARRLLDAGMEVANNNHSAWNIASLLIVRAQCALEEKDAEVAGRDLREAWPFLEPYQPSMGMGGPVQCLVRWWQTMGKLHTARGEIQEAVSANREALAYARRVAEIPQLDGIWPRIVVADALRDLADALEATGQVDTAEAKREEARIIREELHLPAV